MRPLTRRTVLGLALAAPVIPALQGCGSDKPTDSTEAPPAPKEISGTVVVAEPGDNPGDIALRRQLAATFMKTHENVKVQVLIVPATNYDQKVQTMIAGGKPPDIFNTGDVQIPNIASKNFAVDLNAFIARDKYSIDDFYPQIIEGLSYDGKLLGLADNWDTQVMYYNATLFEKASVDPPTADWQWSDFTSAAQKLTSGSGTSKVYGAVFDNWFAPYFDQMWSNGADPFPDNGKTCGYDSAESIQSFDQIIDMYKSGVSPSPSQFSDQGSEQLFLSGRVAMMIGSGRWSAYSFRDVKKFEWKVAPVPKGSKGRANFFHLSMFAIARNSKNPEAAWEFMKFMFSEAGIKQGLAAVQGIPSRRSIAESDSFKSSTFATEHDSVQPFLDSLPTAHRGPNLANFNQVQDTVSAQLDTLWSLKEPPSVVLPKVCEKVKPLLAAGGAPGGG